MPFGKFLTCTFRHFNIFLMGDTITNAMFSGNYFVSLHLKLYKSEWLYKNEYLSCRTPPSNTSQLFPPPFITTPSSGTPSQSIPPTSPSQDTMAQVLSLFQEIDRRMEKLEKRQAKLERNQLKKMRRLERRIDCIEYG